MQLQSVYSCCGLGELADVRPPQTDEEYKAFSDQFYDLLLNRCQYHRILFVAPHHQFGDELPCMYDYMVERMLKDGWKLTDEFPRNTMYGHGTLRLMMYDTTPLLPIIKEQQSAQWRARQAEENRRFEVQQAARIALNIRRAAQLPEEVRRWDEAQAVFREAQRAYMAASERYTRAARNV